MVRAGPLSDDRVIRLLNRRFVPFFFDLSPEGAAGDAAATKFMDQEGRQQGHVVFLSPEGDVLASLDSTATSEKFLATLKKLLADHPDLAKPGADEAKLEAWTDKAELAIDLLDYDGARAILKEQASDRAKYLLGHLARVERDFDSADKHFDTITDRGLLDDVRMERAYRAWFAKDFAKLREQVAEFPRDSNRASEAGYTLGLAQYHAGDKDAAVKTWTAMIKACSQDPWVYRADWAVCSVLDKRKGSFSAGEETPSPLKRIGYMGPKNPDLKGPPK